MKTITKTFLIVAIAINVIFSFAQSPDCVNIKANYQPVVAIPSEYGTPYIQPLNVCGWEDGLQISRDGLHVYAFYSPLDLESYIEQIDTTDMCHNFMNYFRGTLFGMDTICSLFNCSGWIHSDILYASRPLFFNQNQ